MARIALCLAYQGTDFCGWQLQPGLRTVQGELEKAFATICGRQIRVHGSGRTDTGVHATGQVVHTQVPDKNASIPWLKALNSLLPRDVRVTKAGPCAEDFHARFGALKKTYSYTFWLNRDYVLPQRRHFVWHPGKTDPAAMQEAAKQFLGTHDFKAFMNLGTPVKSTVRTVLDIRWAASTTLPELAFFITANGFLKQMVRNIAGCLAFAGSGKVNPEDIRSLLDKGDRALAPPTAPGQGLCLEQVFYKDDPWSTTSTSTSSPELRQPELRQAEPGQPGPQEAEPQIP